MRSSPVAPAPPVRRHLGGEDKTDKSFQTQTTEPFSDVDSSMNRSIEHSVLNSASESPPPLAFSSSMEEDTASRDEGKGLHDDEEEDEYSMDDPYTYSDDSASLNDAYFSQPLSDHGVGVFGFTSDSESERDPLESSFTLTLDHVEDIHSPRRKRGVDSSSSPGKRNRYHGRKTDRQRNALSSSIDEEGPVTESTSLLLHDNDRGTIVGNSTGAVKTAQQGTTTATSYRHRQERKQRQLRKQRRIFRLQQQQQRNLYRQQRQEERERAVTQVRGQPQPETRVDRFWLVLFLLQLVFVCGCAIKNGMSLTQPSVTTLPPTDNLSVSFITASAMGTLPIAKAFDPIKENISTSTVQITLVEHLEDDDNIHPATPDDRAQKLRSKGKSSHASAMNSSSSSSGVTTMTTIATSARADGTTVIFVENAQFTIDYKNVLSLLLISGLYACIISYVSFAFMLIVARSLIPIMLVFTILLLLCWGVFGLTVPTYGGSLISILGFSAFGLSLAYTLFSWNHIPFSSTNLYTAICAMRNSVTILLAGVFSLFVALLWLFVWSIAVMGILNTSNGTDCAMWDECETHIVIRNGRAMELGVLLISLYWTTTVIKNIARVTVADAIGSWWMQSDDTLFEPLHRACTSSLGTICFGSLVGFPAQLLSVIGGCLCWAGGGSARESHRWAATPTKRMSTSAEYKNAQETQIEDRPNEQEEKIDGLSNKMVDDNNCLQRFGRKLQACNRWSYTYIGMYNYSFIEGGEKAIELFETREWMDIVRDNLIQNILLVSSIVIGGSSAVVAVVVEELDGYTFTSLHKPVATSFWIGFILGFVLSNILLLGVVGSAVNTVLVCFAAEPFEFDRNHPGLSREMREVWSQQVWEPDVAS